MNKTKLLLILIFTGVFLFSATAEAGPFDKFKKKVHAEKKKAKKLNKDKRKKRDRKKMHLKPN